MACVIPKIETLAQCAGWTVGLGETMKLGIPSSFTAIPTPPPLTAVATNEEMATAVGTFTAAAGKGFVGVELDSTKELDVNPMVDTNGAMSTSVAGRFAFSKDALGFVKKLAPRSHVIIVIDKPHGERLVIGYAGFEAVIQKWEIKEGSKVSYVDFEIAAKVLPLIYTSAALPMQT